MLTSICLDRRRGIRVGVLTLIVLLVLTRGTLGSHFYANLAHLALDNALWTGHTELSSRQNKLARSARLYAAAAQGPQDARLAPDDSYTVLSAIVAAEHYRRQGQYNLTAAHLYRAAEAPGCSAALDGAIALPGWAQLSTDGAIRLDGSMPRWTVRGDNTAEAAAERLPSGETVLTLWSDTRFRRASFQWRGHLAIPYHHRAVLRSRVDIGCIVRLETVIDGQIIRHFAHPGTGEWEEQEFPIQGQTLEYIYILLDVSDDVGPQSTCTATIDYVAFMLDEGEVACR